MLMLMIVDEEEFKVKSQMLLQYLTPESVNHSRKKSILFTRPWYSKEKIYIMPKFLSPVYVKSHKQTKILTISYSSCIIRFLL